jgi:hypothetical protein
MRYEFTEAQKRAMRERSCGICEAGHDGTEAMYGMARGDACKRPATEFDHVTATALKQEPIRSIDEGLHVCAAHHKIKTHGHDRPKIRKVKRIKARNDGTKRRKGCPIAGRPLPGTKASGVHIHMNRKVTTWKQPTN